VIAKLAGRTPEPWDIMFVGSCVSMGRHAAVVQVARKDDTPRDVVIGGRMAAVIKELVCRGTVFSLRREARRPGSTPIMKGGRTDAGSVH
jgi:NADH:ubiquinone reductase (H+-translocating)